MYNWSSSAAKNFVQEGSVNDIVSHWRCLGSHCFIRLACNNRKLIYNHQQHIRISASLFHAAMVSSAGLILAALLFWSLARIRPRVPRTYNSSNSSTEVRESSHEDSDAVVEPKKSGMLLQYGCKKKSFFVYWADAEIKGRRPFRK